MKKLRIFITGASGFIGKNIIEQLGKKYNFIAPSHKQLNLLNFETVSEFFRKNHGLDLVIHCANIGGTRRVPDTPLVTCNNLRMFFNLIGNKHYFKRMINLGSGADLDKSGPIKMASEDDFGLRIPTDGYGFYKYICTKYIESSENIVNLKLFGVFGKYEDWRIRFISNAICKSIFNLPITINQNVFFDYLYIKDFTKILEFFLNNKVKLKSYNVTAGKAIDLLSLAKKIVLISGKNSPVKVAKEELGDEYTGNNSRLLAEIGNFKYTDIDVAIEELYVWYQKIKTRIKKKDLLNDYF